MKAIGLITFWDNNYGSSLQCYAMKKTLSSMGYRCDLLEEKTSGRSEHYIRMLKKCVRIPCKSLIYPKFGKAYLELRKHARLTKEALSPKSRQDIHFFGITELQPQELTKKALKHIGHSDEYVAFVTGSDQVWGGHFVEPTYGNFLEFSPRSKRISYAASFGSNTIPSYNRLRYKKGIKGIDNLSVREDSGIEIVKQLAQKTALKMPDPTILIPVSEWEDFSKDIPVISEPYVLVHFLDNMSADAVDVLKKIVELKNLKIICLGWKRNEILSLDRASFVDGGPREYISLIRHAHYICTDSFHTTLFSLRFQKQFYTFPRCYAHRFHQTGRVTTLLADTGCLARYIKNTVVDYDDLPDDDIDCSEFFDKQRDIGLRFLRSAIPDVLEQTSTFPNLKPDNECCGCGVCAEKCPKQAIQMVCGEKGYCLPQINEQRCISCGICEKYCRQQTNVVYKKETKQAYIAYSNDNVLLNRSASGGLFSSLAKQFILSGGVVYGAAYNLDEEKMYVSHRCATTIDELYPLLQSKYVQSNAIGCFKEIQDRLIQSQRVLFGGTSCQVDALKRYLGKEYDNLYTMDLICHGVPGEKFFADYVKYLEDRNHSRVVSFSFREKRDGKIQYVQRVMLENGKEIQTEVQKSDYYKLFFSADSYRQGCYNCEYASINKPADMTVGDYFECQRDYPELFEGEDSLKKNNGLSCCISHGDKGRELLLLYGKDLTLIPADLQKIQNSHNNLCFPSKPTDSREKIMELYKKEGFEKIHRYHKHMDRVFFIPRLAKKAVKKAMKIH